MVARLSNDNLDSHFEPPEREVWQKEAACQDEDPEMFFMKGMKDLALQVCNTCPVINECLVYTLNNEREGLRYGVAGGTDVRRRAKIARKLKERMP